jgi:hypothetical protein
MGQGNDTAMTRAPRVATGVCAPRHVLRVQCHAGSARKRAPRRHYAATRPMPSDVDDAVFQTLTQLRAVLPLAGAWGCHPLSTSLRRPNSTRPDAPCLLAPLPCCLTPCPRHLFTLQARRRSLTSSCCAAFSRPARPRWTPRPTHCSSSPPVTALSPPCLAGAPPPAAEARHARRWHWSFCVASPPLSNLTGTDNALAPPCPLPHHPHLRRRLQAAGTGARLPRRQWGPALLRLECTAWRTGGPACRRCRPARLRPRRRRSRSGGRRQPARCRPVGARCWSARSKGVRRQHSGWLRRG